MIPANVKLSKSELSLAENAGIILTKNRIIHKARNLFGLLADAYRHITDTAVDYLPEEVLLIAPKIYKGEQYRGLPYVMLDYPRYFHKLHFFAIRSLFWWGNVLSISLLLSGDYKDEFGEKIYAYFTESEVNQSGWFICIGSDPWDHHFEDDNFLPLTHDTLTLITEKGNGFLKLARKIPVSEWERSFDFFSGTFALIIQEMLHETSISGKND